MRGMIRRAMLVAGPTAILLGLTAGVASASGMSVALNWSPSGTFTYGTLTQQTFKLTNSGTSGSSALTITLKPSSGTLSTTFKKRADTCTGTSLGPNRSCTVTVTYTTPGQAAQATLKATAVAPGITAASVTLDGTAPKATPTLTTTPSQGGAAGSVILNDSATLTGGASPGGSITFSLYGPSDSTCSGTPAYTSGPIAVTGDGTYPSTNTSPANIAGNWNWTVTYTGDNNNNGATSTCGETVAVTFGLTTSTSSTATVGSALGDSATLAGGTSPGGLITFQLFGPDDTNCSKGPVYTASVNANGDGIYSTGDLGATTTGDNTAAAGTYEWTAMYADSHGAVLAGSGCGETVTVSKATPTLTTHADPTGQGNVLNDSATLADGVSPTGTITFNLYPAGDLSCSQKPVFTAIVPVNNGNGLYDTIGAEPPTQGYPATAGNTYEWTATYSGDDNNSTVTSHCGSDQVSV